MSTEWPLRALTPKTKEASAFEEVDISATNALAFLVITSPVVLIGRESQVVVLVQLLDLCLADAAALDLLLHPTLN